MHRFFFFFHDQVLRKASAKLTRQLTQPRDPGSKWRIPHNYKLNNKVQHTRPVFDLLQVSFLTIFYRISDWLIHKLVLFDGLHESFALPLFTCQDASLLPCVNDFKVP